MEIERANEILFKRFKVVESRTGFPGLLRKIVILQDIQENLYLQKLTDRPPNYICLDCGTNCYQDLIQTTENAIQDFQREILRLIEIEFESPFNSMLFVE